MRPESMDAVFLSLASEKRRQILDIVKNNPGCCVSDVCKSFDVTRIAVMRHITMLEDANLLIADKRGRSRHLYVNSVPIQMIYDRWTTEFSGMWAGRLLDIKYLAEQRTDDESLAKLKDAKNEQK